MKMKLLTRLLCALLSVLMLVCMIPAITISAANETHEKKIQNLVAIKYKDADARLAAMTLYFTSADGSYSLYCDTDRGDVAYRNNKTGEILFTNPWDPTKETNSESRETMLSQITLKYVDNKIVDENKAIALNSYADAVLKGQILVSPIKNGLRVEYAIGERSARLLLPQMIERMDFEEKILIPIYENATTREYQQFKSYFNEMFYMDYLSEGRNEYAEAVAKEYPITAQKSIDIYVLQYNLGENKLRELEAMILEYCPEYTFEEMDNDHAFVEYEEEAISPPVFKMALEYTLDEGGLVVNLPANGLRYDESTYRVTELSILPYMGASSTKNEGYTFMPDGSGTLFNLQDTIPLTSTRVYGEDYAMAKKVSDSHAQIIRMPVFGQVETIVNEVEGTSTKRGFLGIIEAGESLASLSAYHQPSIAQYARVGATFLTRPFETASTGSTPWLIYAGKRYVEDYRIRYIMLSDDNKAAEAGLPNYYECSWMGMACAYRDYLDTNKTGFDRLTAETTKSSIPLYIETFGCVDSVEKIMSIPITVSVALTSFNDVATMYDYLAAQGVTNVNFKLTGYANGGMYSDVPYKLKWEDSVGSYGGFADLAAYAAEKGFALYPDFDFVYTTHSEGGFHVNMKRNAARTIENRYTARRMYSATKQGLVSYYQMVMAPETYSHFYTNLLGQYAGYEHATGVSLATFGNSLNSDFDENKTSLREDTKGFVIEALEYFKKDYDIMLDGANSFTWNYADHILRVPLDSSRYNYEMNNVPFMGVVLHGYVEFAGSPLNMEGNLSYAMLKAMENGASVYFVLSYANTELLKEDELLSQNYSVRYDIWQAKLVEIYAELNAVLADVQTKLIVDHQFLDGTRIADSDELLEDIAQVAKDKAAEIEQLLLDKHNAEVAALRQARLAATEAAAKINGMTDYVTLLDQERASVTGSGTKYLCNAWNMLLLERAGSGMTDDTLRQFKQYFRDSVVYRVLSMRENTKNAAQYVISAKEAYEYLVSVDAVDSMQAAALEGVNDALDAYEALMTKYAGRTASVASLDGITSVEELEAAVVYTGTAVDALTDAAALEEFILGETYVSATGMGAEALYQSFVNLLIAQGLYDPADPTASVINVDALIEELSKSNTPDNEENEEEEEPEDVVVVNPKYEIDGDIVLVTYGEKGQKFGDAGTKTFILNFNDYAVQTTLSNGVTYTVDAYGYVVIYS